MARAVLLIVVGALAGGGALALAFHWVSGAGHAGDEVAHESGPAQPLPAGLKVPEAFEDMRAAHESAARLSDPAAIGIAVERTAEAAASVQRDAQLEALLARLAEIDPRAAVNLAQRLELGESRLTRLFQAWAGSDPDAALTELAGLRPPSAQRAVALSLLDVFGINDAGVERVAAVLEPARAGHFRIDAIGKLAERDVGAAVAKALGLGFAGAQTVALQRVADTMAKIDPRAALEQAGQIQIALQRTMYRERLLNAWAEIDPEAMLGYFETADLSEMQINVQAFRAVAASDPARLLEVASRFPPNNRRNAQRAALEALVDIDAAAAYAQIMALPPTGDRNLFIQSISERLLQRDPNGALTWAMSLEPRSTVALNTVLARMAVTDPARVADVAIAEIFDPVAANRGSVPNIASLMTQAMQAGSPDVTRVADRLAAHDDPRVRNQLRQMLEIWPALDAASAFEWAVRHPERLDRYSAQLVAQLAAVEDPTGAAAAMQHMPSNLQAGWAVGVAAGLAENDLEGALQWVERFEGDRFYEDARLNVIISSVRTQPEAAAQLVSNASGAEASLFSTVAQVWASQDPAATAEWLGSLAGIPEPMQGSAARIVAAQWARRDLPRAERWVMDLPVGATRDGGLNGLVQAAAGTGSLDQALFDRFSTDESRANAVVSAMLFLAARDPDLGRLLIETYIRDPQQRRSAEQQLENGLAMRGGAAGATFTISDGDIIVR